MIAKIQEKENAITLRKRGLSYSEILRQVPVAKSTLSLWLHSIGLAKKQKHRLTEKKLAAIRRGGKAKREQRLILTKKIKIAAAGDIGEITRRDLWLMGIMLYWAEGSKEKEWKPGSGVRFCNSDPYMIKLFLKWLSEIIDIPSDQVKFRIAIHENHIERIPLVRRYWADATNFPVEKFNTVYLKKHKPKTNRRNTGDNYYGLLEVVISRSSALNRKIAGWIEGINAYYWKNFK